VCLQLYTVFQNIDTSHNLWYDYIHRQQTKLHKPVFIMYNLNVTHTVFGTRIRNTHWQFQKEKKMWKFTFKTYSKDDNCIVLHHQFTLISGEAINCRSLTVVWIPSLLLITTQYDWPMQIRHVGTRIYLELCKLDF